MVNVVFHDDQRATKMFSDEGEHGQDVVGSALRTDIGGDKFDPRIPEYFQEGQYKHMKHNGPTEQKHELI